MIEYAGPEWSLASRSQAEGDWTILQTRDRIRHGRVHPLLYDNIRMDERRGWGIYCKTDGGTALGEASRLVLSNCGDGKETTLRVLDEI